MDANFKEKWVAALRSGNYKQAQYSLKDAKGFCCLGVLCDLYDNTKWEEVDSTRGYSNYKLGDGTIESTWLPDKLAKALEIDSTSVAELVTMNDRDNKSFAEIADHIEKNL